LSKEAARDPREKRPDFADAHRLVSASAHLCALALLMFVPRRYTDSESMLRAGIVGLPNVGKSTLFNAITRTRFHFNV